MAALVHLVEVDDVRVARLDPAARRPPDLTGERREAERDRRRRQRLVACGRGVRPVGLPVRAGRGGAGARQPVQRDVVEDVVAGEVARGLPVDERVGDLVVGVGVVVDHPGGQSDRRVEQRVADRLRAGGHLDEVAVPGLLEGGDLRGRGAFLVAVGRHGASQRRHEQVRVDADQPLGCLASHRVGDAGAHVAALGDIPGVAESAHELGPGPCGPAQVPADLDRLARETVARQRGQNEMERILGTAAVRGRVRQGADGVDQLHDGAGPAMGHDQRQRVLVRRPDVDEVDVHPVDLGRELRERVQPRLAGAPVVLGRPVANERLQRRQLHALRPIGGELSRRPARRLDPAAQLLELLLWNPSLERADGCRGDGYDGLLRSPAAYSATISGGSETSIARCG